METAAQYMIWSVEQLYLLWQLQEKASAAFL